MLAITSSLVHPSKDFPQLCTCFLWTIMIFPYLVSGEGVLLDKESVADMGL